MDGKHANYAQIIPITIDKHQQFVNARDLHQALEVKRDFSTWIKTRLEEVDARYGTDFYVLDGSPNLGSREPEYKNGLGTQKIDYALSLSIAQEIAMLERTPIGKNIRRYFIATRDAYLALQNQQIAAPKTRVQILEEALESERRAEQLEIEKNQLESRVQELEPAAEAFHTHLDSTGTFLISEVAKEISNGKYGEQKLYQFLRDRGVLIATGKERNLPYQIHINTGRFVVKGGTYRRPIPGSDHMEDIATRTTRVTPRGIEYIRKLIIEHGEPS